MRTCVPPGVCTSAFSSRILAICNRRCSSAIARTDRGASNLEVVPALERNGRELRRGGSRHLVEGDGLAVEVYVPGVQAREVEQLGCELLQPLYLLAHRGEELASRLLVQLLVVEQLEKAAEREDRRPQLV